MLRIQKKLLTLSILFTIFIPVFAHGKADIEEVKGLTIRAELVKEKAKDLKVIYTPIHGSGNMPVRRVLAELGYENVEYKYTGGNVGWKGDVPKSQYDLTKIHNAGWQAHHTSDESVRETAKYIKEHY